MRAEGLRNKKKMVVEYDNGVFLFNGQTNYEEEYAVISAMQRGFSIGGTYYPETDTLLNIVSVLTNHYFDKPVRVAAQIQEVIPNDDGGVY